MKNISVDSHSLLLTKFLYKYRTMHVAGAQVEMKKKIRRLRGNLSVGTCSDFHQTFLFSVLYWDRVCSY